MDNIARLATEFLMKHPLDAARILERHAVEDLAVFLESSPVESSARVLTIMDTIVVERTLSLMREETCAVLLCELPLEVAALYLRGMSECRRSDILRIMSPEIGGALEKILRYPPGTVGSLMDPLVFTVPEDLLVRELVKRLQKQKHHVLDYVYVIDRENSLIGYITLRDLMTADPRVSVVTVLLKNDTTLPATSPVGSVMNHPAWSEFRALPVVDKSGMFLGALEHRTLRRLTAHYSARGDSAAVRAAGTALGELFWIGMSGLVSGATYVIKREE